jgi:hypothetical protein
VVPAKNVQLTATYPKKTSAAGGTNESVLQFRFKVRRSFARFVASAPLLQNWKLESFSFLGFFMKHFCRGLKKVTKNEKRVSDRRRLPRTANTPKNP